jgi:hypothetical protein
VPQRDAEPAVSSADEPAPQLAAAPAEVPVPRAPEPAEQQALFDLPVQHPSPEAEAAADDETPGTADAPPQLGPRERAVLEFETRRFKHAGRKEQAIRDEFDISPTQYFQIVNALLDDPAALAHYPTLVARLRRLRELRRQARR